MGVCTGATQVVPSSSLQPMPMVVPTAASSEKYVTKTRPVTALAQG